MLLEIVSQHNRKLPSLLDAYLDFLRAIAYDGGNAVSNEG